MRDIQIDTIWLHLNELEETPYDRLENHSVKVYTFTHEDLGLQLEKATQQLRGEFIWADGVIWPEWMEGRVKDLDPEVLQALEWVVVLDDSLTESHLEEVQQYFETNGDSNDE